jgi:protein-L-isoaspartate(D-aspartate) O-methyltransferase
LAGDGSVGYPEAAPFDRILISAATPALPEPLADQLAEGGRLLAPVGGLSVQTCKVITKRGGELATRDSIDCVFVPLRGEYGWQE